MSAYDNYNDLLVSSNNTINDNRVNAKRAQSTGHQIKQLLRPILALLRKHKKNTYRKNVQPDHHETEIEQNNQNEMLEARIFDEIDDCDDLSAVPVYDEGRMDLLQIFRGQRYIPVHFARTEAGTFFWTSIVGADCDVSRCGDKNPITAHQRPELQVACDRWAQA